MSDIKSRTIENEEIGKLWEDYSKKYNRLSDELSKANIDIQLLVEAVRATKAFYTYKQDLNNDANIVKKIPGSRKPKYIAMEFESRRKDAYRRYKGSKTGSIYKILRIVKEYTNEAEADLDLARLKAGEISEDDVIRKKKKE